MFPKMKGFFIDDIIIHQYGEFAKSFVKPDRSRIMKFLEKFDLDFVKLAYDGKNLFIYDFDSVVNKKCTINIMEKIL